MSPLTPYRLVFPGGVANLTVRVDPSMTAAYQGEFYGPKPRVTEADGLVSIDYSQFNPFRWGRASADVRLNPSSSWAIEIRGGVSHWDSDLRNLELNGIEVRGGVNKADLQLPPPKGSSIVRISVGVSHLTLRRPAGVPARLLIGGGASKLELDAQYLGAVGGPGRPGNPPFSQPTARNHRQIGGGASPSTG